MSSLVVNTNLSAIQTLNDLNATNNAEATAINRLSSGLQIENAATGPAQYVISQSLESEANGYGTAISNAQDGVSMIQTVSGALSQISSILQTMEQLALTSANGATETATALTANQSEFQDLKTSINEISDTTTFGTTKLLVGENTPKTSYTGTLQVGAFDTTDQRISLTINAVTSAALGLTGTVTQKGAATAAGTAVTGAATGASVTGAAAVKVKTAATPGTLVLTFASKTITTTASTLSFTVDGKAVTVTLTAGATTVTAVKTKIDTAVTAQTATATVALSGTTKVITITSGKAGAATLTTVLATAKTDLGTASLTSVATAGTAATVTGSGTLKFSVKVGTVSTSYTVTITTNESLKTVVATVASKSSTKVKASVASTKLTLTTTATGKTVTLTVTKLTALGYSAKGTKTGAPANKFTLATKGTFKFSVASDGATKDYTVALTAGTYGLGTLVTSINKTFSAEVTASVKTTKLSFTTVAAGSTVKLTVTGFAGAGFSTAAVATGTAFSTSGTTVSLTNSIDAESAVTAIQTAIQSVDKTASFVGATENELNAIVSNLTIGQQNLQAADSQLVDVNMAQEMTTFSTDQILMQSGVSMLAQAQQLPSLVLKLMGA